MNSAAAPAQEAKKMTTQRNGGSRRSRLLDFTDYEHDPKKGLADRAADALHWAAENFPKQFIAQNILLKAVMGYAKTPKLDSSEVEALRKKMTRIRKLLRVNFGRGLVSARGLGVRATVDDEDQLKTDVVAAANRFASASKSLQNAGSLVDIRNVAKTPENKPWIDWWNGKRGGIGLAAQIAAVPNYINMLQPPSESSTDDDDGDKDK